MKISELHPFSARIARDGKPVIRVDVYGLGGGIWKKLAAKLESMSGVQHVSDISGLVYFTSRRLADQFASAARKAGKKVETAVGKIDTSGLSYDFVERVGRGEWI